MCRPAHLHLPPLLLRPAVRHCEPHRCAWVDLQLVGWEPAAVPPAGRPAATCLASRGGIQRPPLPTCHVLAPPQTRSSCAACCRCTSRSSGRGWSSEWRPTAAPRSAGGARWAGAEAWLGWGAGCWVTHLRWTAARCGGSFDGNDIVISGPTTNAGACFRRKPTWACSQVRRGAAWVSQEEPAPVPVPVPAAAALAPACACHTLNPPLPARPAGMRVTAAPGGQEGRIEGGFGKSGKFKVFFPGGAPRPQPGAPPPRVLLRFKRFLFDADRRRMAQ